MPSVLIVVGGLPGTGKSTTAARLASATATPYLRVDRIEQTIIARSCLTHPVGAVGHAAASALAGEQLGFGIDVIVECVNPPAITRAAWISVAEGAGAAVVEVELVCSDTAEHPPPSRDPGPRTSRDWSSRHGRRSLAGSTSPGIGTNHA